eukprot:RCo051280
MGASKSTLKKSKLTSLQHSNNLSAAEILKLHSIFKLMATGQKGKKKKELTLERMVAGCKQIGMTDAQVDSLRTLFPVLDRDKNGTVDFEEYVLAIAVMTDQAHLDMKIDLTFSLFDVDGDKRITKPELATALKYLNRVLEISEFYSCSDAAPGEGTEGAQSISFAMMTEEDFDRYIDSWVGKLYSEFDLDHSEYLDPEEFKKVVQRHPFLVELNSRLVTEGPASFLPGSAGAKTLPESPLTD